MEKEYKYKFSVVIPIYNVEEYLAETLDSVIQQTIGFEENIQMILVNDGSPDNSEEICLKYKELYPNNIIYIKQKNAGVSAARNNGINYIEGEFVNFLDSDDVWEKDVFEKAYKMLSENPAVDVVGVRQKYFEASNGYPSLDYKFKKDRIVNVFNDYSYIQLSVTSAFFRASAIGDIRYDTKVKYSEDAKFLFEIILQKENLGIIGSSQHLYRKRLADNSAIQRKLYNLDWYTVTLERCYKYVFELSKKKYGYVIPFVQYYVAYDYQWRIKDKVPKDIYEQIIEKYKEDTKELFSEVDDYIIMEQRNLFSEYKLHLLDLKYDNKVFDNLIYRDRKLYFKNIPVINFASDKIIKLTIFDTDDDYVEIKGIFNLYLPEEDYKLYYVINDKKTNLIELKDTKIYERAFLGEKFMSNKGFSIKIPKNKLKSISFKLVYKDKYINKMGFHTAIDSKLDKSVKSYYTDNNKIYYISYNSIKLRNKTLKNSLIFKIRYLKQLIKQKKYDVIFTRILYYILKLIHKKEIWILSDRPNTANDNGYALFKYLNKIKDKTINLYFVIDKNADDYKKVKRTGKVLKYNSLKYKIYFMLSSKVVSSQADEWVGNPFGKEAKYYADLFKTKILFLQHGIIKDDLSLWLNQYEKNLKMFVTSVEKEYKSIIDGEYGFDENVVKLTGLPRYDLLEDKKEKLIAIMPTWRTNLSCGIDIKTGKRTYNQNFKNSDYFNFYNQLINDKRLINVLKKNGYKCVFVMHSGHQANIDDFDNNEYIDILDASINYSEIFSKAALLITDFSSVAFDFGYLRKPVIYTQFDKEEFFLNQIYSEGYFDYEKDGIGPVYYNYEDTVNGIIEYIKNDCKINNEYLKRINDFYKFNDRNNCKRVYEEIKKIK